MSEGWSHLVVALASFFVGAVLFGVLISTSAELRDGNRVRDGWMSHEGKLYLITPAKPVGGTP